MEARIAARWIYFIGAVILAFTLAWFGWQLLHTTANSFSSSQLFLFGLITTTVGISLLTLTGQKQMWLPGVLVVLVGFYGWARAAEVVQEPWLEHALGIVTWLAAALLLWAAWPLRSKEGPDDAKNRR